MPPRRTSPNKAARRARALELLVSGLEVAAVAKKLGVARITVSRWQSEMRAEIDAASKAKIDGIVSGATKAKELLASKTVQAAKKVVRIMERPGATETESKINRVALAAAVVVLDRGGVPAKSTVEASGPNGGPIQVETWAERIRRKAAQYAAEKPKP